MKTYGFTFPILDLKTRHTIDCFCVTDRVKKSKGLIIEIIKLLRDDYGYDLSIDDGYTYDMLQYYLKRATLTERHTETSGKLFYSIDGITSQFSYGGFPDDVLIIVLDH